MHHKVLFLFFGALLGSACNKEIDSVAQPPFSIAPNPCQGSFILYPDPAVQNGQSLVYTLYAPDGALLAKHIFIPATTQPLAFQLEDEGAHFLEMTIDEQSFQAEILNLK